MVLFFWGGHSVSRCAAGWCPQKGTKGEIDLEAGRTQDGVFLNQSNAVFFKENSKRTPLRVKVKKKFKTDRFLRILLCYKIHIFQSIACFFRWGVCNVKFEPTTKVIAINPSFFFLFRWWKRGFCWCSKFFSFFFGFLCCFFLLLGFQRITFFSKSKGKAHFHSWAESTCWAHLEDLWRRHFWNKVYF